MRRTLVVWAVVMLVVLLLATPDLVAAKGGAPRFFSLTGTITELDEYEEYLMVSVLDGNSLVKQYIGEELKSLVTEGTLYWRCTGEGRDYIPYSELQLGDTVFIHGTFGSGHFVAERVVVDKP